MSPDRLARASSGSDLLLRLTSLQFPSLVVFSPGLRDFASSPAPNGLEIAIDADHGGVFFEVPADNPQRRGDYGRKTVS